MEINSISSSCSSGTENSVKSDRKEHLAAFSGDQSTLDSSKETSSPSCIKEIFKSIRLFFERLFCFCKTEKSNNSGNTGSKEQKGETLPPQQEEMVQLITPFHSKSGKLNRVIEKLLNHSLIQRDLPTKIFLLMQTSSSSELLKFEGQNLASANAELESIQESVSSDPDCMAFIAQLEPNQTVNLISYPPGIQNRQNLARLHKPPEFSMIPLALSERQADLAVLLSQKLNGRVGMQEFEDWQQSLSV